MRFPISRPLKYLIVLFEIVLVIASAIMGYNFFFPPGKGDSPIYFNDTNTSQIFKSLKEHGYALTSWDRYLITPPLIEHSGWYEIAHLEGGRYHFFQMLKHSPAPTMQVKIYAGETHDDILTRLANDMKLERTRLEEAYHARAALDEGDILAGRYTLARKANEKSVIDYLFMRSKERFEKFEKDHYLSRLESDTRKFLLTVASIIQKETNDPKEMPIIASIIYNRLDRNMKLQMDSTLNYGIYSHQIVTPERIRNDTTHYNTYKYKGLPPAPLGSVSLSALEAAMFPAKTDYLFFMLHKDGGHVFSKTYKEHLGHIKAFRAYQREKKRKQKPSTPTAKKRSKKAA